MFTASTPRMYTRFHSSSSFRSFSKRCCSSSKSKRFNQHSHSAYSATTISSSSSSTNAMWRLRTSPLSPSSYLQSFSSLSSICISPPLPIGSASASTALSNAMAGLRCPAMASGLVMDAQSLLLCAEEDDDGRLTGRRAFTTLARQSAASASASASAVASETTATTNTSSSSNSPRISHVSQILQQKFPTPSTTSLSSSSYSNILDPANPPLLALTHYQLLLSHVFNDALVRREHDRENKNIEAEYAAQLSKASAAPEQSGGASVKLALELMEKAGGERVRDSIDFLNRLSDEELMDAMAARTLENEEIDVPLRPPKALKKTKLDIALSDERFFHPDALKSGENFEHLKRVSAYAFLMRRRLATSLGLSRTDVERITESGRLSKTLFRIVEHELTPSHWRFIGLVNSEDVDITSLGTLGSTASLAKLSANNEWQSTYYPRRLTSRANRQKYCRLCIGEANRDPRYKLSFLNVELLHQFINTRGKIIGRRFTRVCAKHQRKLNTEIKRARNIGLLAWLSDWKVPDEFVKEFYGAREQLKQIFEEAEEEKEEEQKEKERKKQHLGISDTDLGKPRPNIADELGLNVDELRAKYLKKKMSNEERILARAEDVSDALEGEEEEAPLRTETLPGAVVLEHLTKTIVSQDPELQKMNAEFEAGIEKLKADALDPNEVTLPEDDDPIEMRALTKQTPYLGEVDTMTVLSKYAEDNNMVETDEYDAIDSARDEEADEQDGQQSGAENNKDGEAEPEFDLVDETESLLENRLARIPLRTRESVLLTGRRPKTLADLEAMSPEDKERREINARRKRFRKEHLLVGAVREKSLGESLANEESERTLERLDEIFQIKGFERDKRHTAFRSKKEVFAPEELDDNDVGGRRRGSKADADYVHQEWEKGFDRVRKDDMKTATETESTGKKKKK